MLRDPAALLSGEKGELLGQKLCVPKVKHQICQTCVSAPMSPVGGEAAGAGYIFVCAHVPAADAWRRGHKWESPKTEL